MNTTEIALKETEKPHYTGHRQRLRLRFLQTPKGSLPDYELLELMLFAASPRLDVKPIAKQLLMRFGSLAGVITAHIDALRLVKGMNDAAVAQLKAVQDMAERLIKQDI